jgi:hypothetical protein
MKLLLAHSHLEPVTLSSHPWCIVSLVLARTAGVCDDVVLAIVLRVCDQQAFEVCQIRRVIGVHQENDLQIGWQEDHHIVQHRGLTAT